MVILAAVAALLIMPTIWKRPVVGLYVLVLSLIHI